MPFPSNQGTKADDLARAWDLARNTAGQVKVAAQRVRNDSASAPIDATRILNLANVLGNARGSLSRAAAVPGIAAYAQEQVNDPSLDVANAFVQMQAQITAVMNWILAAFPADVNGYLLYVRVDSNGVLSYRTFDSAATAGLRTQLDALIATID